jgi:LysM repeat protein
MRKFIFLIMALLLIVTGVVSAHETVYTVQPGDTITGIARAFGVSQEAILIRNSIIDPNRIRRGQQLIIPTGAVTVPMTHVVKPGERLTDIAIRYNTTVDELIALNHIGNPNYLVVGQVLTLPASSGPAEYPRTYRVDIGDTLRSIGEKFGVSWQAIAAYNNIQNPNLIYAGSVIKIPPADYRPPAHHQPPTYYDKPAEQPPKYDQPPHYDARPKHITYVVQAGDVLELIGQKFGVSAEAIRRANGITNSRHIYPGDVLIIPVGQDGYQSRPYQHQPRQAHGGYYVVQPGDTMFAIAWSFGVNVYDLAEANGILNLNLIYAGQRLKIPGRY